jgi:hypothetical protein
VRGFGLLAGALAASLLAGACGTDLGSAATPAPDLASPITTPSVPPSSPAPTLPMPSGASVARDPSLLAVLPSTVSGTAVGEEPDSFAEAVKDPAFVASVDRAAFAIAASGSDFASGVVAHIRTGVYSDKMFEDWRSSYDEGACAQSGGVLAHASQTLASRTVYVTTCGGGLRVYHAYLADRGVIVSLLSAGPNDFGAQLMGGLGG